MNDPVETSSPQRPRGWAPPCCTARPAPIRLGRNASPFPSSLLLRILRTLSPGASGTHTSWKWASPSSSAMARSSPVTCSFWATGERRREGLRPGARSSIVSWPGWNSLAASSRFNRRRLMSRWRKGWHRVSECVFGNGITKRRPSRSRPTTSCCAPWRARPAKACCRTSHSSGTWTWNRVPPRW